MHFSKKKIHIPTNTYENINLLKEHKEKKQQSTKKIYTKKA